MAEEQKDAPPIREAYDNDQPGEPRPMTRSTSSKWTTCCSRTEPAFIRYISQLVIAYTVLLFAITMLALGRESPYYSGLVGLVVGHFLPEPRYNAK
jgi:hypothetical protein